MNPVQFNYPAIFLAALVSFVVGGAWYSPLLFVKAWTQEAGLDAARLRSARLGRVFALSLSSPWSWRSTSSPSSAPGRRSPSVGAFAGFATGLGWVGMSLAIIYLFEQRSLKLWLIDTGWQIVSNTLMGALIGGWK